MPTHLEQYSVYHAQIQADFIEEKIGRGQTVSRQNLHRRRDRNSYQMGTVVEYLQEQTTPRTPKEQLTTLSRPITEHLLSKIGHLETRIEVLNNSEQHISETRMDNLGVQVAQNENAISLMGEQITQVGKRVSDIEIRGGSGFGTGQTSGYHTGSTAYGSGTQPTPNYQGFGDSNISPQRVEALHSRVVELEHSVDRALSSSLDLELRIQLLERATYNGVLLWKIDEFDRRRREAVDGVTMSLYSTPFYTSRHGYKMCARIYLNGDGMGKGSHLSFFFVVMRGPFDASLQWPFKQKVTLTLINQNGKKHISDSFRPDPHSSSFQKPGRREMNIASGFPMFIRIDHLLNGGFVKDDAIYVRVVVETMDLPKIIP